MKLLLLCLCVAAASAGLAPLITSNQRSARDSWIVKIKGADQVDNVAGEVAAMFSRRRLPQPPMTKLRRILPALLLRIPSFLLDEMRSLPNIEYIEQDSIMTIAGTQYNPSWGLDRIDSRSALDGVFTYNDNALGQGVNAYILDTGVQTTHTAFGGRAHLLYGGPDDHGHGTHCAGTVMGAVYGIARQAQIYSLKVCDSSGKCTLSSMMTALQKTVEHADGRGGVVSISLSGVNGDSPSLSAAVKEAWDSDLSVAWSAGNSGADACQYTPQKLSEVITVGATTSKDKMASYSNHGPCVDILAPGSGILSAMYSASSDDATATKSGTSMACPHVAGALAVLKGTTANPTSQNVKDALLDGATKDVISGVGSSNNKFLYVSPN